MPDENEPTNEMEAPGNDPQAPDTAPLIRQAIAEMVQTREILIERFDRFENEIRKELRTFARRLDVLSVEMNKTQAEVRDIDERVATLEQKPA